MGDDMGILAHGTVEIWMATQLAGGYYSTDKTAESTGGVQAGRSHVGVTAPDIGTELEGWWSVSAG